MRRGKKIGEQYQSIIYVYGASTLRRGATVPCIPYRQRVVESKAKLFSTTVGNRHKYMPRSAYRNSATPVTTGARREQVSRRGLGP